MLRLLKNDEPDTPPLDRVTIFCGQDGLLKMKRDDGTISIFAGTGIGNETVVEYFTLTSQNILDKFVTLLNTPFPANQTMLDIISCGPQFYLDDFIVSGNQLTWENKPLQDVLDVGDKLRVQYRK